MLKGLTIVVTVVASTAILAAAEEPRAQGKLPPESIGFLDTYCLKCHQGEKPKGKLDLTRFRTVDSMAAEPGKWSKILGRVHDGSMPPVGNPAPGPQAREQFIDLTRKSLYAILCASGPRPGPAPIRRLNRTEYGATIRDLLGIQYSPTESLPEDGAGGEGFDNAAETLFLSPLHAEKYLETVRAVLESARRDPRSSRQFLIAQPSEETLPARAAQTILERFMPRAFRRPLAEREVEPYVALFERAQKRGDSFEESVIFALRGVLMSPHFLFRLEQPNADARPRLVGDYEIASRLSFFLWASMPDDQLIRLAGEGKLNQAETLREQAARMLRDRRTRESVESFVEQWLGTRELGRNIKPDRELHPQYTNELEWCFKQEPVLFVQHILAENRPLLDLLDSDYTFLDSKLARYYGIQAAKLRQQLVRVDLPKDSHRGGLLGMAGVLTVSSLPNRTSPVLRGKWVLETLLGDPPPPPPPDVPQLDEKHDKNEPQTLRQRLENHRRNPTCATCHNRIDPIGFGLENYGLLGKWRTEEGGKAIDARGELPDGTRFDGPQELKQVLLRRKDDFVRHLTTKMLGYALGRGLTIEDQCTVEEIVAKVREGEYKSHVLIAEIACSVPFRYRAGLAPLSPPGRGVGGEGAARNALRDALDPRPSSVSQGSGANPAAPSPPPAPLPGGERGEKKK